MTNRFRLPKIRKAAALLWLLFSPVLVAAQTSIQTAAEQYEKWLPMVQGKKLGLVVNHTAVVGKQHLLDLLLDQKQTVLAVYAPEHGFRGEAEAGAGIKDGKDSKTGIPIVSLYGKKKKPLPADLKGVELLIFDMQDVGARFYTYISTLHYVMEACAELSIPLLVLDRPNPNGHYIDGPILDTAFRSFVGMHPVPVVHGMTIGEYACMINGEGWLAGGLSCSLEVFKVAGYDHQKVYQLPIPPSPNLPDMRSVYLYPSTCFFEGVKVSLGRGTDKPFQLAGTPWFRGGDTSFVPRSIPGKAANPPFLNETCYGYSFVNRSLQDLQAQKQIDLQPLIDFYRQAPDKKDFFLPFFEKLAGGAELRKQIEAGATAEAIRGSWKPGLKAFAVTRAKYLLYPHTP
ncbi:MAG: exo-beta-N-acetylmuramidase NamZ domain-containing protein [Bacteroidia bacterium]